MKLGDVFASLAERIAVSDVTPQLTPGLKERTIARALSDSRQITGDGGQIFVALGGTQTDGHQYLEKAAVQGALVLVVDQARVRDLALPENVAVWAVENTYLALAHLCHLLAGSPCETLRMVGVTGTNGKTTVTHLIEQILLHQQKKVGLIGTLGFKGAARTPEPGADAYDPTSHTTPMATELYDILADMKQAGDEYVVMEVSSHALEQHRTAGCHFEVAVLTNVTQDHLDYHKTMDQYWRAKALLFEGLTASSQHPRAAVINLDSEYAERFVAACPPHVRPMTYALDHAGAAVRADDVVYRIEGSTFSVTTPVGAADVHLKIPGRFSVYNALAAIATAIALGMPLPDAVAAIESVSGIRGRFELVASQPYVIVDYAHTPDGLENILSATRLVIPEGGRLIAVFGCGGDRDATKRPRMGRIAETLADVLVITSDNPRTEDPQQIITDVIAGIQRFESQRMIVNPDRQQAIHQAIDLARPEDIIVVAGKGHEDYQIIGTTKIHFDDREIVQAYMRQSPQTTGGPRA
ncbi:MAG: UDP-N-acetylmuramoyl-L-alanyl-D-glutamate--2,6-diaminopimelate ligase [Candidatus Melainabacteria bacterium]